MALKLLHISDIHFKDFQNHQYLDLDREVQREIELDLASLKDHYGKIDVVLIGGDIAFSGKENEYEVADTWIKKICGITECQEENVLTVPGNHDVQRDKIVSLVKTVQKDVKEQDTRVKLDRKINELMLHAESSELMMCTLQNYRNFAQKFGSIPDANNKLYWEKDFPIDGRVIRIRGVNSAFVSSELDNEQTSKLALGSSQTNFLRENGLIYLVLCHHPPTWLIDGDEALNDLKARARINLFGHKHLFNVDFYNNDCLVLAAGAMQPSRGESDWEPRYNILEIDITSLHGKPVLQVKLFKRVWNKIKRKFKADFTDDGKDFEEYHLNLSPEEAKSTIVKSTVVATPSAAVNPTPMAVSVIDPTTPDPRRKLAYLFLGLPYHTKLQIAVKLGLIEESDRGLDEIQKAETYFKRANEGSLFHELWEAINAATGSTSYNPFPKKIKNDSKLT